MHFFNPVPMMQLVEVIRALRTTDEVCATVVTLVDKLGKKARIFKDSYGSVVNRVLIPMINEAINCVHEGLALPEDIDVMMKLRRQPSNGSIVASRSYRARCCPRYYGDPIPGLRRPQLPAEPTP